MNHSVWISSRLPSRALTKFISPIKKATGKKLSLSGVLEWGKLIWVKDLHTRKLDPRAKEGKFVGYDDKSKGYRVYWPGKNRVSVERNIYFDQGTLLKLKKVAFEGEWELIGETVDKVNKSTENPIANLRPTPSNQQLDQDKITQNDVPNNNTTTVQPNDKTDQITNPAPNPVSLNRQNSLKGLPQYDQKLFGCGKCSKNMTNVVKGEGRVRGSGMGRK